MSYMSQLDNFRSVLSKAEPDVDVSKNTEIKHEAGMETLKDKRSGRKKVRSGHAGSMGGEAKLKRTSIGLPGELHEKLKIVSLWMKKEGVMDNPGLVDVVNELLDFYLEKHPSANKLLKLFYDE